MRRNVVANQTQQHDTEITDQEYGTQCVVGNDIGLVGQDIGKAQGEEEKRMCKVRLLEKFNKSGSNSRDNERYS